MSILKIINSKKKQFAFIKNKKINYLFYLLLLFWFGCVDDNQATIAVNDNPNLGITTISKTFGYDGFSFEIVTNDVVGDFSIVNATADFPEQIKIVKESGVVKVAEGMDAGKYTFQVGVKKDSAGEVAIITPPLTIEINPIEIMSAEDYLVLENSRQFYYDAKEIKISMKDEEFGYKESFSFGRILKEGVGADLAIINKKATSDSFPGEISAKDGAIQVNQGIDIGTYTFDVQVEAVKNYTGFSQEFFKEIYPFSLSISFPSVASIPSYPSPSASFGDNPVGIDNIHSVEIDGVSYLLVLNEGLSIFGFTDGADNPQIRHIATYNKSNFESIIANNIIPYIYLYYASFATAEVNGATYAFLASKAFGRNPPNITVLKIASDKIEYQYRVHDFNFPNVLYPDPSIGDSVKNGDIRNDIDYPLSGSISLATAEVNGVNYLLVAGEDKVSVFSISADGKLTSVSTINDNDNNKYRLKGASSLVVKELGGNTYLFVNGKDENGISVFTLEDNGDLTHVDSISDEANLSDVNFIDALEINDFLYVFASLGGDTTLKKERGFSVFSFDNNSLNYITTLANKDAPDNIFYRLINVSGFATQEIAGETHLFVTGYSDRYDPGEEHNASAYQANGVSVFKVDGEGNGINFNHLVSFDDKKDKAIKAISSFSAFNSSLATMELNNSTYFFVSYEHGDNNKFYGFNMFKLK